MPASLINQRWVDIPETDIFRNLTRVGLAIWGDQIVGGQHYLFGGDYAYPYSLPAGVVQRLAAQLNEVEYMTWYRDYNMAAAKHFSETGEALNQALEYWRAVNNPDLPKPNVNPVDGLEDGEVYIAILGLFHLAGEQNHDSNNLYIDLIDEEGNRIYANDPPLYLYWGWEGMSPDQVRDTSPVRIDKGLNEPGANIGLTWGQIVYGFHINNIATDRFSGVHIRYPGDEPGNSRGHHSHYIVLQRRKYYVADRPPPVEPPPDPEPIVTSALTGELQITVNKAWIARLQADDQGNVTFIVRIKDEIS